MVKHIILWRLREDLAPEEKQHVKQDIKAGLEGLAGRIPGLLSISVNVDGRLDSSNADIMLDSTFTDEASLKAYASAPVSTSRSTNSLRDAMTPRRQGRGMKTKVSEVVM